MCARLEFEIVLEAGRGAAVVIDFRGASYVGVKHETKSKDISRALVLFI